MKKQELHELVSKLKKITLENDKVPSRIEFIEESGIPYWKLDKIMGGYGKLLELAGIEHQEELIDKPNILVLDIETLPMEVYAWDLYQDHTPIDMIIKDWSIASWAAKWLGEEKIMYQDQRNKPLSELRDDEEMLKQIYSLIDQADIVVTQNGISFDMKKLNARFFKHKFKPPTSYKNYDTKIIAQRFFKFSSNKLAYMTEEFNEAYKKLDHGNFPGFKLWKECMKGNKKAWKEMEEYNKHDVFALEELFMLMLPWDTTINWNVYNTSANNFCTCGSTKFLPHKKNKHTNVGKYERLVCVNCGKEFFKRDNLLSKEKRKNLIKQVDVLR